MWSCLVVLGSGCWGGGGRYDVKKISSARPEVASKAMTQAAEKKDREAIFPLVKRLYGDDAAMRLSAILALKEITGEDMGYRLYESEVERMAAIQRWENWLIAEGLPEVEVSEEEEERLEE